VTAKKRRNWFYVLLAPVGAAFVVTAFAYGLMAFQAVHAAPAEAAAVRSHPLFAWLRVYGDAAMLAEVAALGLLTVAAIATDGWRTGGQRREGAPSKS
jgi:hypothetical protein